MKKIETAVFVVRVQPSATSDEWIGLMDDNVLKIKLRAKPIDGMANAGLIEFLSQHLNIKKADLEIITGQKSRVKKIRVFGKGQQEVDLLINKLSKNHP